MFMMAEYLHMVVGAAVVATLFLGGWQFPYLGTRVPLPGRGIRCASAALVLLLRIGSFVLKTLFFCWLYVWVRWTVPGSGTTR